MPGSGNPQAQVTAITGGHGTAHTCITDYAARSRVLTEALLLVYSLPGLSSMARPPTSSLSPSSQLMRAGFGSDCACQPPS